MELLAQPMGEQEQCVLVVEEVEEEQQAPSEGCAHHHAPPAEQEEEDALLDLHQLLRDVLYQKIMATQHRGQEVEVSGR